MLYSIGQTRGLATANRSRVSICGRPCKKFLHIWFDHRAKSGCRFSSMCARVRSQKFGDPAPLGWGMAYTLETRSSHTCVTVPNFVVLGQFGNPAEHLTPVPPFKVTQGHWNGHGSIGCL